MHPPPVGVTSEDRLDTERVAALGHKCGVAGRVRACGARARTLGCGGNCAVRLRVASLGWSVAAAQKAEEGCGYCDCRAAGLRYRRAGQREAEVPC